MAKNKPAGAPARKSQWFARRQVYLRAGQDSQYVELSPLLQIGVAIGIGALALWLAGASYAAISDAFVDDEQTALMAKLNSAEQALEEVGHERDEALEDAARVADLEAALAAAQTEEAAAVPDTSETLALTDELEQTRDQLEDVRLQLSESKADHAALQARSETENLAATDADEKTTEEASSLHAQLEDAFGEIEALQKQRDEATAQLSALNEDVTAKGEATERNTALLEAATAEIERLQKTLVLAQSEADDGTNSYRTTISSLEQQLEKTTAERDEFEREIEVLSNELTAADSSGTAAAADAEEISTANAELQAQSIEADLREADLLATIEGLRDQLDAAPAEADQLVEVDDAVTQALRRRANIAEAELERLILAGLRQNDRPLEPAPTPAAEQTSAQTSAAAPAANGADSEESAEETERLRSELLAAQADIIKLNADVKAARQRLEAQAENQNGETSRPDNSAKLEQQLASSRSRVQQLNKALADAKLREVAIDLALISVVPVPSPPAPR